MRKLYLLVATLLATSASYAQLLTWFPPNANDGTTGFIIVLDATKGNGALVGHTPTSDVYVHTGVITSASANASDWKYVRDFGVPNVFNTTTPQLQAAAGGTDKWSYTIPGTIRAFYGVPAGEKILKIAILFRSGNGSKVQRNRDGSDMYIPVFDFGTLGARVVSPFLQPTFVPIPEPHTYTVGSIIPVRGTYAFADSAKMYVNGNVVATDLVVIGGVNYTVTALGTHQFVVRAWKGGVSVSDTATLFIGPASSPTAALPAGVRDGINYQSGDTSVILVLPTPAGGKNIVSVIGDFNAWTPSLPFVMNKTADGKRFWLRITGLTPGTEYAYQYLIDNNLKLADPYTQKILDPFNDAFINATRYPGLKPYPAGQTGIVSVLQTREPTYTWSTGAFARPDQRGLVIYETLLRDFVAAQDWKTLRDTLGYLKRLGVNTIQMMPFNEFEGNNSWGYNPSFYFAPDKYYGPKNDLKRFIDTAHRMGMAVVMDMALNHAFGQSPTVQMYFDAANNRPSPENPWHNPEAKHPFNVGYDFNHESLETRLLTARVIEHWLQEYRIDGFRWDLSKGFTQRNTPTDVGAWGAYDASRVAIWKRYHDTAQLKAPGSYTILEHFADNNEEKELSDYGMMLWGNENHQYSEGVMGYTSNLTNGLSDARGWSKRHLVTYAESHDEERLMYRALSSGSTTGGYNVRDTTIALSRGELAGTFLLAQPGPKMIWQFGELGYHFSINRCTDGTINDNCRLSDKPIRWDYRNDARRAKVYNAYARMGRLRNLPQYAAAFTTGAVQHSLNGTYKWLKLSSGDTSHLVVIGNWGVTQQVVDIAFPTTGNWFDYVADTVVRVPTALQSFNLAPGQYMVFLNRNVNNVTVTAPPAPPTPVAPPTAFAASVYPNPARGGATNLSVEIPANGRLTVELINSAGQKVSDIHGSNRLTGRYVVPLTGMDMRSSGGVYYLRVMHRGEVKVLPIVLAP